MKQNPNNSAKISLKSIPKPECRIPESFWQITEEDYENMEVEYDILCENLCREEHPDASTEEILKLATQNYPTFHGYEMNDKKYLQYKNLLELLHQLYGSSREITMAARKDPDHVNHFSMVAAGFRSFAEFHGEAKVCLLRMVETADEVLMENSKDGITMMRFLVKDVWKSEQES